MPPPTRSLEQREDLSLDVGLELGEVGPAEAGHYGAPRDPDHVPELPRFHDRVPDLAVLQVVVVQSGRPERLPVEGELGDVGEVHGVEEEDLGVLEVLLVEPLQDLWWDPRLDDLT